MKNKKIILNLLIICFIFFLDRISKLYILSIAQDQGLVDLKINSFLNLVLIWNTGIGFGLFQFEENLIYYIITFLIVIVNLIIIYLFFSSNNTHRIFLSLILGGSLGNLFDRIYYSAVPDFIDINYNGYHWFVFNVADIFITIGILALIFLEILRKNEN